MNNSPNKSALDEFSSIQHRKMQSKMVILNRSWQRIYLEKEFHCMEVYKLTTIINIL